ncbi:MAG: 1,4-dihydroxy-2-naphthoate octaprenyltransferase [Vicingaceae bacterium]
MANLSIWLNASRPRTLPLSLSGIITGSALAIGEGIFTLSIFIPALFTTLALQVLSNFANDYGDASKGTDGENRIGPKRMVQSGFLSIKEIKRAIFFTAGFSFAMGVLLLITAFGWSKAKFFALFMVLGLIAIWAAMQYTMGKRAYGYKGLGDVFVLIFFGFVAVSGSFFLYAKEINGLALLQSLVIGCMATGVLHLNNMRDREQDKSSGKITLAVMMGPQYSRNYFYALLLTASASIVLATLITQDHFMDFLPLIAIIPLGMILIRVLKVTQNRDYNQFLKPLALSTFFYSIILFISNIA